MDHTNRQMRLYTAQPTDIIKGVENGETHYAKMSLIKKKYAELGPVFVAPYLWYVAAAEKIVKRHKEAESAVWAYGNVEAMELSGDIALLEILVPIEETVSITMDLWRKRLNNLYIGTDETDEAAFRQEIKAKGMGYMGEIVLSNFYPLEKKKIEDSWNRMFEVDRQIKADENYPIAFDLQVGLWCIKPEWVIKRLSPD